ncbi:MAG: hypothetical protein HRU15_17020, partial [Planctomycetes bacterium]|nr:hypothetical protein [Planctomycetota bacterium]
AGEGVQQDLDGIGDVPALVVVDVSADEGFPGRLRARRSALSWICDRAISWSELADPLATREDLEDLVEILGEMYTTTEDKWEGEDPPIWQLQKRFKSLLDDMPAPPAEIEELSDMPAPDGMPSPAGFAAVAGATQVQIGGISSRGEAFAALRQVALFIETTEPHSPVVPLLHRAIEWSGLSFQDLYAQLLGRFPTGHAYVWDTLGLSMENVEGGEESLPPESRGGHEVSMAAPVNIMQTQPTASIAPKVSPVAAVITPSPAVESSPDSTGDDMPTPAAESDDMPSPTIL